MKDCNSCGKCCIKYSNGGLSASAGDIQLWDLHHPNISRYVHDGKIWMDPVSFEQITLCPWLGQTAPGAPYTCAIYADRPEDCRIYPVILEDMVKDACEMLEPRDLANPVGAQRELDQRRLAP